MLKHLPEIIQKQILKYLDTNHYSAAKTLHDAWLANQAFRFPSNNQSPVSLNMESFMLRGKALWVERIFS